MKTIWPSILKTSTLVLTFALAVGSCNLFTNGDGEGTLNLSLTDAPIAGSDIESVFVQFTKLEYNTAADGNGESFVEFEDFAADKYDLLTLTNGESTLLDQLSLPAGTYSQLRFYVAEGSSSDSTAGSYVVLADGTEAPLFIPGGEQTGYKASVDNGTFTVPSNGSVSITADFDVSKSIVQRGSTGDFILKPRLRLIVDDQAGEISGSVTYDGDSTNELVVYAYEDPAEDDDTEDEFDASVDLVTDSTSDQEQPYFSNSVTSSVVETDGSYTLAYLAGGTYDLYVAEYDSSGALIDDTLDKLDTLTDVEVTAGVPTTNQDITVTATAQ